MLYAVIHKGMSAWGITRDRDVAVCCALAWNEKHSREAEVWSHADGPEVSAWDWPAFRINATRIYPIGG